MLQLSLYKKADMALERAHQHRYMGSHVLPLPLNDDLSLVRGCLGMHGSHSKIPVLQPPCAGLKMAKS